MYKSLYFKIVLILLIFIIAVMCAVGAILMNGVTSFYIRDFTGQMQECFADDGMLMTELSQAAGDTKYADSMKQVLSSYGSILGIDQYRNYYVLNTDGEMLSGSDSELGKELAVTPNILASINSSDENISTGGMDYADWAVRLGAGSDTDCIIYIKDSLEEMRQLNQMLLTIILQSMLIGILIAVLLSFFLAKAISSPLQSLTYDTQLVASGEFSHEIEVRSSDEIGVLADNFNYMKERLRATLEEVDGEREKLDIVLSCMRDAVLAFTSDGHVLHYNNSAVELFGEGLKNDELGIEQCFEKLDLPLVLEGNSIRLTSKDAAAEHTKDGFLFRDRTCDAKVYDVSFAVIRYVTEKKQSSGCVIIIHDVTSRYELDESRREFVSNVSHELKTPLTSIKAYTETILSEPDMDTETREYFLGIVLSESDRMHRIVSDLLVLSRLDNKRTNWNIETFDLRQSVRRLCEVMRGQISEHGHKISFGCQRGLPEITADKQRIEQVILNILSNAIKYTPDGGKIEIKLTQVPRGFVRIEIADNGIGIPDNDVGHLFERFYRVEKSRTQDAGGTGLGLAIAKELVEAHGGVISVKSRLGEGTVVTIDLPTECRLETKERQKK